MGETSDQRNILKSVLGCVKLFGPYQSKGAVNITNFQWAAPCMCHSGNKEGFSLQPRDCAGGGVENMIDKEGQFKENFVLEKSS